MKRLLILIGMVSALVPASGLAQSLYDMLYEEAGYALFNVEPTKEVADYVIKAMKEWGKDRGINGITITTTDMTYAQQWELQKLCENKKDAQGKPLQEFLYGNCTLLASDIRSLIEAEREVQQLANDLFALESTAMIDEPRPMANVALTATAVRRLWTGTGGELAGWPDSEPVRQAFQRLESTLGGSTADMDAIVYRFRFGVFRDTREDDPRLRDYGNNVKEALLNLAGELGIDGDPTDTGEFATPPLAIKNVVLWARKDDLGLTWAYPLHYPRFRIKLADEYPAFATGGDKLAYPFAYTGALEPDDTDLWKNPVCARTAGVQGFLCRTHEIESPQGCVTTSTENTIQLSRCDVRRETTLSPTLCSGSLLFNDRNQTLQEIDEQADKLQTMSACSPDKKVLYKDEISGHACYISDCLAQSLKDHTLTGGRNPVVSLEMASPFLGYQKPDPQLGIFAEMNTAASRPDLPPYIGVDLVREFDREICAQLGLAPHALAGYCTYADKGRYASTLLLLSQQAASAFQEAGDLSIDQENIEALAASIGLKASLDQSLPMYRSLTHSLSQVVQAIADLFAQLERAPPPINACPWTGPLEPPLF